MSTHNLGFYEEMAKITFQLSSITHFTCSSDKLFAQTNLSENLGSLQQFFGKTSH